MVEFCVPGDAVSFGTKNTVFRRDGQLVRGTRKTDAAADWQADVRRYAAAAADGTLMDGPVEVAVHCRFGLPASKHRKREPRPAEWKTTKPDGDKILRLVCDALEGVVYGHDAQVCRARIEKVVAGQGAPAVTMITVCELNSEDCPDGSEQMEAA